MTALRAVIGLGANLGDRLATMRRAADAIERLSRSVERSHVYETAPVGPPQPDFLNAAMRITFEQTPRRLLDALLAIESDLGRTRGERWGPRTIDLDILWVEGVALESDGLTLPHPHLERRAFALAPMLELVPDARDPRSGARYVLPAGDARGVRTLAERL